MDAALSIHRSPDLEPDFPARIADRTRYEYTRKLSVDVLACEGTRVAKLSDEMWSARAVSHVNRGVVAVCQVFHS